MGALGVMKVIACGISTFTQFSVQFSSIQFTTALIGVYDMIVLSQYPVCITSLPVNWRDD